MAKKNNSKGIFRIKDVDTGLYYHKKWIMIDKKKGYSEGNFTHWDKIGSIWDNRGSAERMLTQITRVKKDKRDTQAKKVLYGNKETASYTIVECDIVDKE